MTDLSDEVLRSYAEGRYIMTHPGVATPSDVMAMARELSRRREAIAAIAADKTAAVAAEREACAKIAENWSYPFPRTDAISIIGADIAKAIRKQKT